MINLYNPTVRRREPENVKELSDGVSTFTQALIYKGLARKDLRHPAEIAEAAGAPRRVVDYLKANAGSLTSDLISDDPANLSFIDYLRNTSALDAMRSFMVPAPQAETRFAITAASWSANATAEGLAKAVQTHTITETNLTKKKATAIVAVTDEFLQQPVKNFSSYVARALRDAVASQMNTTFFGSDEANQATGSAGPGMTLAETLADLRELMKMVGSGTGSQLYLWVNPDQAVWLTSMAMSVGSNDMSPLGGRFCGINVGVSDDLPSGHVFLVDATGLAWWEGGVTQSVTTEADVELSTTPAGSAITPTSGSTNTVSMWQTNGQAYRVERRYSFGVIRPNAIASLNGVGWGAEDSPIGSGDA